MQALKHVTVFSISDTYKTWKKLLTNVLETPLLGQRYDCGHVIPRLQCPSIDFRSVMTAYVPNWELI